MIKNPTSYEIYLITAPGYWYVGSTTRGAARRFKEHLRDCHSGKKLQNKIRELGPGSFKQTVVEKNTGDPIEAEAKWYDFYFAHDARETLNGKRPGGWDGHQHSPEQIEIRRQRMMGNTLSAGISPSLETRDKISKARKGFSHTPEAKVKMSEAHIGRIVSDEARAKMSQSQTGRKHSEETLVKMRVAQIGVPKKMCKNNTSGYKGVHFDKQTGKWCARIQISGVRTCLGYFDDPYEAHLAVEAAR